MGGVGFEPPSSESDLRKSKKNVRRGNRTHDLYAVKESQRKWKKIDVRRGNLTHDFLDRFKDKN